MGGVSKGAGGYGTFTCGRCGGRFAKDRGDSATMAEARSLFTGGALGDVTLVCDGCWPAVLEHARAQAPEVLLPGVPRARDPAPQNQDAPLRGVLHV